MTFHVAVWSPQYPYDTDACNWNKIQNYPCRWSLVAIPHVAGTKFRTILCVARRNAAFLGVRPIFASAWDSAVFCCCFFGGFLRCSAQCCLSFRIGRFFCLFVCFFVVVFFALTAMWLEILAISLCCSAQCGFRSNLPILCVARWLEILANSLCCSAQCGLRFRASKKSAFATPSPPPSAALVKLHANAVVLFKIITLKCRGQKCLAIPKP